MINDIDISIVVQGPILFDSANHITNTVTRDVCLRIRKLFPESELILSTWKGQNTEGIPYDKLLLNEDPGATWFNYGDEKLLNNCNRLIVSTREGIKAASRPYVLKVRSDLFMVSKSFLSYFDQFLCFDKKYQFVKSRILAFSLYSVKAHRNCLFTMQRPFHISDWAYFGYKDDLLDLYDIPLTEEPQFSQWFLNRCKNFFDIEPGRLWKMPPEQYVTSCFLKKHMTINFEHTTDISHNNVNLSEAVLANNFLVLDQTQFSLISLKYLNFQLLYPPLLSSTAIFYQTWLKDYYRYCKVPRTFKFYQHKIQMTWRYCWYKILNFSLRRFHHSISSLVAFFIKKWYLKK